MKNENFLSPIKKKVNTFSLLYVLKKYYTFFLRILLWFERYSPEKKPRIVIFIKIKFFDIGGKG